MSEENIDALKRKKLEELAAHQQEEEELKQELFKAEAAIKTLMTREAIVRFGNIKAADPEKAMQITAVIINLVNSGQVRSVDDEILKRILATITPKKKDINIRRINK